MLAQFMAYTGEILRACDLNLFRNKDFAYVIVSGSSSNPCGHMLLNFGGLHGYYAHAGADFGIDIRYKVPRYMDQSGYERYLLEHGKKELYRESFLVPNPPAALLKLEQLLSEKWPYKLLWDNCVTFVEVIARAGGATFQMPINCPVLRVPPRKELIGMWL